MVGVNTFLETSTIHGLNFISTTRKFTRLLWILVVLTGFTTAAYLIQTSFKSWTDSPIKTTVETLPISELKFPKVTVCPPKNTYTDLNYDLMLAENITLTEEMRNELIEYSNEVIDEHIFMDDLDILKEDDRYFNWYYGYSMIWRTLKSSENQLNYFINTSATSGVVTTQYFGEVCQPNILWWNIYHKVQVFPPESIRNNTNVTLHFNLEKVSMTGLSKGWEIVQIDNEDSSPEEWETSATFNFTPPAGEWGYREFSFDRHNILGEDFLSNELESMPGFRLSWYYTGLGDNITPDSSNSDFQETQQFIRQ